MAILLFACLAACSGCLDFDKETIVVVLAPDKDEARLLFLYEGLCAGSSDSSPDSAEQDLRELVESGHCFYLFPGYFGLVDLSKDRTGESDEVLSKRWRELLTLRIEGFFLNRDRRLCVWQTMRVHSLSNTVAIMNEMCSVAIAKSLTATREEMKNGGTNHYDIAALEARERAVKQHFRWFEVEPGRITLTLLAGEKEIEKAKSEVARELKGASPEHMQDANLIIDFLLQNTVSIDHRNDRFRISLGVAGGQPIRVTVPGVSNDKRQFEKELSDYARSLPLSFRTSNDAESVIQEFLKHEPYATFHAQ